MFGYWPRFAHLARQLRRDDQDSSQQADDSLQKAQSQEPNQEDALEKVVRSCQRNG